tara:strand:- start:19 stop:219 length:201 start_codon:yes stop_codon:yes gene_type:complete
MKVGDLVRMKEEPFLLNPYGLGFLISYHHNALGCNCCVLFLDLIGPHFDGLKWCNDKDLEVANESG